MRHVSQFVARCALRGPTASSSKFASRLALVAAALAGLPGAASAQVFTNWTGGSGNFTDPTKWTAGVPGTDSIGIITANAATGVGTATINASDVITARELNIGQNEASFGTTGNGAVIQNGGDLTITDWLTVGRFGPSFTGSYTMTGGTINKSGGGLFSVNLGGDALSTFTASGSSVINNNGPGDTRVGAGAGGGTMTIGDTVQFNHVGSQFKVGDGIRSVGTMTMNNAAKVTANREVFIGIYGGDGALTLNGTASIAKTGTGQFAICDSFFRNEDPTVGVLTLHDNATVDITQDNTNGINGEFWVGQGVNGTGTLNMDGNSSVTARNRIQVGRDGGNGTVNLGGNATLAHEGLNTAGDPTYLEIGIFGNNGNGTFRQTGGTLDMRSGGTRIGDNTSNGTYELSAGVAHFGTELSAGLFGSASGTLTMTGGTADTDAVNLATAASTGSGSVTVSGGTLDVRTSIVLARNPTGGNGTLAVSGSGIVRLTGAAGSVVIGENSTGVLTLAGNGQFQSAAPVVFGLRNSSESTATVTYGTSRGTLNLDGGVLTAPSIRGGNGNVSLNFNGGTLRATADEANYLQNVFDFTSEIAAGGLAFDTNGFAVGINVPLDGAGGLTKRGAGTLTLTSVQAYTGTTRVEAGTLKLDAATGVSRVRGLDLGTAAAPGGTLDLSGKPLVVDYTGASPVDAVRQALGRGAIASAGLPANQAIGYAERTFFATLPAIYGTNVDNTSLLLRPTVRGDATLNGQVNFDDLLALARNYNGTGKVWTTGDFTYDGTVGFDDLLALARNYNTALTGAQSVTLGAAFAADFALAQALVPEPTTLTALGLAGGLLVRRRRA